MPMVLQSRYGTRSSKERRGITRLRWAIRCLVIGCVVGCLALTGSATRGSGTSRLLNLSSTNAYATGCTNWPNYFSRFTGFFNGGWGGSAGSIKASITINQPVYVCGNENAYWDMVEGGSKSGCLENSVYAQTGWLVGSNYVPYHFYEASNFGSCDNGPLPGAQASYGTTHYYKTEVGKDGNGNSTGWFYLDGNLLGTLGLNWSGGNDFQLAGETHEQENRVGGESFRDVNYCTVSYSPCEPASA